MNVNTKYKPSYLEKTPHFMTALSFHCNLHAILEHSEAWLLMVRRDINQSFIIYISINDICFTV